MSSRGLPGLGIVALLIAALVYLFLPTDPPVDPGGPQNDVAAEEDAREAVSAQASEQPAIETDAEQEATRAEVELPVVETDEDDAPDELAIHGRVDAVGLLAEEMLVRLVLLDVPQDEIEDFDGLEILSWIDQDWVRQSKPRPIDANGSFVLRGTPPPARFGTVRRYIASIGIETGGHGFPMAEGQTVLPVAISPALIGDEHPAENPLVLEAASPYRVRLNPAVDSKMLWAIHSITVNLNLEHITEADVSEEEDPFMPTEWLEVPPVPIGGLYWESWISRVAPPLQLESVFIDDWLHWEVEIHDPIPVNGDLELDVTCEPVGHLIAKLPVAIKPEEMPHQRWAADLEEEVQFRVLSEQGENFGLGWTSAYSWELLLGELPELDMGSHVDRARVAGLHFDYEPDQTWIQLGWFEPGSWKAEVITPDGTRWNSDPVNVTVGSAQVIEMRAEQALPMLQIRMPAGYRGALPQDAHFLNEAGEPLSLSVTTPEEDVTESDDFAWEVRVPREARSLEAWAYDSASDLLQIFSVDFPPGDLPAEVSLTTRNTEGEIRPPSPFLPYVGLAIYPMAEDVMTSFARSFVLFLEEEDGVEAVKVRGLTPGRYIATGLSGGLESGEISEIKFDIR